MVKNDTPEIPGLFDDLPEEAPQEQIAKISLRSWRTHLASIRTLDKRIEKLIDEAVKQALAQGRKLTSADIGRVFQRHPELRAALDKTMQQLNDDLTATIEQGSKDAWLRANTAADAVVAAMANNNAQLAALLNAGNNKPQNDRALRAFQQREMQGLKLSDRVWRATEGMKLDMERAIEVALAEGVPAHKLSERVRELLKEPYRLYRRVRDKDGNLRLSQAAQKYHPGTGVYRSSYKNAMRVARTEVNMAYQASDSERWTRSWWVKGIRVSLSNNHTSPDSKGRPAALVDICDELAGDYPADFKFTGWHPQCRCFATAITCEYADIRDYYRRKRAGEDMTDYTPPGTITEPPEQFKRWMADNSDRLAGAAQRRTTPYFIANNAKYVGINNKNNSPSNERAIQTEHVKLKWEGLKGLDKWIQETYDVSAEKAKEIRGTVRSFTTVNYEQIRRVQRGETAGMTKAQIRNFTNRGEILEELISKSALWNGTTYRGVLLSPKELEALRKQLSSETCEMGGIASWTSDKEVAMRFSFGTEANKLDRTSKIYGDNKSQRVILVAESHSNAASIAPMSARPGEKEVLASNNCRYRLIKEEKIGDVVYIYVAPAKKAPPKT